MTALARLLSGLAPALILTLGLSACDRPAPEQDAGPAAAPGVQVVAPEVPAEPQAEAPPPPPATTPTPTPAAPAPSAPPSPPPAAAAPRWDVSRTGDGATATLVDARGPILRITCTSSPARLRVNVPRFRPIAREERLSLALGNNAIALTAGRGGGGVTAVGALPANIAGRILRARSIEARYGRQVVGPFTPPRGADAMTLANACEEAVSPAPQRPEPPLPGDGRREQIPVNFRGEWNTRLQDCGTGRNDTRLIIDARTVRFYESRGEVTGVTRDGPRSITVEARYTGEGRTWNRSARMTLSRDGDRLTIDGAARQRCPAGEARPGGRDGR